MQSEKPSAAEQLACNLEAWRRSGDGFIACCPAHDDKNPSLSINEDEDGKVLVYCHAGCEQDEVIEALRELGFWKSTARERPREEAPDGWSAMVSAPRSMPHPDFCKLCGTKPADWYEYRDCDGRLRGYVCRIEGLDGRKSFRPITPWIGPEGPRWRVAGFSHPKPLFGLLGLARNPREPVLIVEGEKTAVEAEELFPDHVVITWPGGAQGAASVDWHPLQGRDVTIWPDADEPGKHAAEEIAANLQLIGVTAKIVTLPSDLPRGWDLADPKPKGLDIEDLLLGAKEARGFGLVDLLLTARQLSEMEVPVREMVIDPFLPTSSINLLYAQRGVGKTWVGMTLAMSVAMGEDFLPFEVPERRGVLYIDGEMPLAMLKDRVVAIGADKLDNFHILPSESLFQGSGPLNIHSKKDQARIDAMLQKIDVDLVIFDNLSSLRSGIDENDNSTLDVFLHWLLALRHKGYALLLVHHAGKGGDQRGASRLEDFLDTTIKLVAVSKDDAEDEGACFDWNFTKTRGSPVKPDRIRLRLKPQDDGTLSWKFGEAPQRKPQHKTLRAIYFGPESDGSSLFEKQLDLAKATGLQKAAISKHVKALRRDNLLSDQALEATDAGIERLRELFPDDDFEVIAKFPV